MCRYSCRCTCWEPASSCMPTWLPRYKSVRLRFRRVWREAGWQPSRKAEVDESIFKEMFGPGFFEMLRRCSIESTWEHPTAEESFQLVHHWLAPAFAQVLQILNLIVNYPRYRQSLQSFSWSILILLNCLSSNDQAFGSAPKEKTLR